VTPQKWNAFLEQFAMAICGKTTVMVVFDRSESRGNVSTALNADPESQRKYDNYYSAIDSWYQHGKHLLTTGSVVTGQMLCPDRVLEKSEFYNDFLRPVDDYHEICGVISSEDRLLSMLTCMRAERHGPFEQEERRLLSTLMPHLQTAVQLHRKVVAIENQKTLAESALDQFEVGLFVVDAQGKVLLMNRTARAICERTDGFTITRNGLRAQRIDEQRRLAELVRAAAAPMCKRSVGSGGAMKISRPSLQRPFHILVGPFQAQGPWLPDKHAAALVFVTDPESQALPDTELFEHYLGLTRAGNHEGQYKLYSHSSLLPECDLEKWLVFTLRIWTSRSWWLHPKEHFHSSGSDSQEQGRPPRSRCGF
jgi:PAS domain-containing protein